MEPIKPDANELHRALVDKNLENVRTLVQAGADVNEVHRQETAFTRAAEEVISQTDDLCVEAILNSPNFDPNACNQFDQTPLHVASKVGRADWVAKLVEKGSRLDVADVGGLSPLVSCATSDSDACASILIQHGASLNQRTKNGMTPLHCACAKGATRVARLLLAHGSDVNAACNKGVTPLMYAVSFYYHYTFGNKKCTDLLNLCEALVSAGCDLNAFDNNGKTALHREVESNNLYGVYFLVQHGCDINVRNLVGLTPYQSATLPESTKYELARFLLFHGATVEPDAKKERYLEHQRTCPIHRVMKGISKYKLNDQAVICRSLLLQSLSESVFPRNFSYRDDVPSPQRSAAAGTTTQGSTDEAASSPFNFQRLCEVEQTVSLWARQASGEPCSLQHQSKLRIRAALGGVNVIAKIQQLPVGASMKRYLNLGVPLEKSSIYKEVRLQAAVLSNDIAEVRESIQSGANIHAILDGESALSLALRSGTDSVISELFKQISTASKASQSPHSVALSHTSSPSSIRELSAEGLANTHFSTLGETVLHLVAKAGRKKSVPEALKIRKMDLNARNFAGRTALEESVCHGHFSTAECLLELGALMPPSDVTSDAPSLLHLAAASGAKRLVEMLLERGADVNSLDKFGFTPLRLALGGGRDYLERNIPLPGLYRSELEQALDSVQMTVRVSGPLLAQAASSDTAEVQGLLLQQAPSEDDDTNREHAGQ
ncbi:ankyrin-3 [Elysia marginata]|uniref:Ankyrin-3 n=1 Tax=Elysia marginata TaxID=1093978 RepID=A0AAV4EXG0_9GAST|nr:ankyrin-3 [Elysia marginata]